jgi:hypothetical protein
VVGGLFVISVTTPGIGTLADIGDWWSKPIVFQKFAVWTLVWEILGIGSGSMQLAFNGEWRRSCPLRVPRFTTGAPG